MKQYRVHLSEDSEYHTQRNNLVIPLTSCNTTSAIMFLKSSGIEFQCERDRFAGITQPEDYLTMMLRTDEAYKKMAELAPWAVGKFPPNEVHLVIAWGINQLVGAEVAMFSVRHTIRTMLFGLLKGGAAIASGVFAGFNHIVCVEGFSSAQDLRNIRGAQELDLEAVDGIWIDDPYGNPLMNYQSHKGNDIELTFDEFDTMINTVNDPNRKWLHLLTPLGMEQVKPKPIKIIEI